MHWWILFKLLNSAHIYLRRMNLWTLFLNSHREAMVSTRSIVINENKEFELVTFFRDLGEVSTIRSSFVGSSTILQEIYIRRSMSCSTKDKSSWRDFNWSCMSCFRLYDLFEPIRSLLPRNFEDYSYIGDCWDKNAEATYI